MQLEWNTAFSGKQISFVLQNKIFFNGRFFKNCEPLFCIRLYSFRNISHVSTTVIRQIVPLKHPLTSTKIVMRSKTHQQTQIMAWWTDNVDIHYIRPGIHALRNPSRGEQLRKLVLGISGVLFHHLALALLVAYLCEDVAHLDRRLRTTEASWTFSKHCKSYQNHAKLMTSARKTSTTNLSTTQGVIVT